MPAEFITFIRGKNLRAERQSARMSKITNDHLTSSGTGCCIHMTTVGIKGI